MNATAQCHVISLLEGAWGLGIRYYTYTMQTDIIIVIAGYIPTTSCI
jgi:hypothetical protein